MPTSSPRRGLSSPGLPRFPRNAEVSSRGTVDTCKWRCGRGARFADPDPGVRPARPGHRVLLPGPGGRADEGAEGRRPLCEVKTGNYLVSARARQAALLARLASWTKHGRCCPPRAAKRCAKRQADSGTGGTAARQQGSHAAYEVLSEGLKRFPDSADLLYDRAMVAEKPGQPDVAGSRFAPGDRTASRRCPGLQCAGLHPGRPHNRLAEAMSLLDKALALAPEDPFILDSVGWAQYRAGNLARAQEYLERAYKVRPDPEIAAHLGEVLWARGQRDEAGKLWQTSLQTHPQNEVLLETLRRLKP